MKKDIEKARCDTCNRAIDEVPAVFETQCRDCFVDEMCSEINLRIYEIHKICRIDMYDLLHGSGMFMAISKLRRMGKGEQWK